MARNHLYDAHPDDVARLVQFRQKLRAVREGRGISAAQLSRDMGRSVEAASAFERGERASPLVSTLQVWAAALDLRMEFSLEGWTDLGYSDPRTEALFKASRPWDAHDQMRMWLVSALRTWRVAKGIDVVELATLMGASESKPIRDWEANSRDPMLFRATWQARCMGTAVSWELQDKDRRPV